MQLKWKRDSTGKPYLYVFEDTIWKHYKQANKYVPDAQMSTQSGFHTAQAYLKKGYTYIQGIEEYGDN